MKESNSGGGFNVNEIMQSQQDLNRINFQGPTGTTQFFGPGVPPPGTETATAEELQAQIDAINKQFGYETFNTSGDSPQRKQHKAQINALQQRIAAIQGGFDFPSTSATVVQTLSPEEQAKLDLQNRVILQLGGRAEGMIEHLPGLGEPLYGDTPSRYEQAAFDRAMGLINPQQELQEERLRQRLANQGLPQAGRAFEGELGRFEDTRNRAIEQAALAATMQGYDLEAAARAAQLNELLTLLGLQQVSPPQVMTPGQIQPVIPPQQQGGDGPGLASGLLGLGGAALGGYFGGPMGASVGYTAGSGLGSAFEG